MDKIAQERSILNKLREKINVPNSYIEGFFKPELDRVMSSLKELDDRIRSALTGKKIGTADAPDDGMAVKDLLKSARTNFNRREYMAGVADLGHFHKKMWDVTRDIDKFFVDVNKIHHKFLFEGLPENQQNNLQKFREHMDAIQRKASIDSIVKEAGIMDFFYNIGTKRGRSLAAWEKKYPKQTKDLRDGGDRLINEAQKLLDNTIGYLKQMATARATRRPDEYMDIAQKIKSDFDKFDSGNKGFRDYYNNAIVPWLKIKDEIDAKEQVKTPSATEVVSSPGKMELGARPPSTATPAAPQTMTTQPLGGPPGTSAPFTPAPPPNFPEEEKTDPNMVIPLVKKLPEETKIAPAHQSFYESLEALSKEDPIILSKYISKYAFSIQHSDPAIAIRLFSIARQVKG